MVGPLSLLQKLSELSKHGIEIRSYIPGRLRFRVLQLRNNPELNTRLVQELSSVPGIKGVEVHVHSQNVVVHFDRPTFDAAFNEQPLLDAMQRLFPDVNTDLWHYLWVGTKSESAKSG